MGCICSKGVLTREQNKVGQPLLDTTVRKDDTVLELDSGNEEFTAGPDVECLLASPEQCLSYGPEAVEVVLLRALQLEQKQITVTVEEKPESELERILTYLYMNWKDILQDPSIIEALKETRFVTSADGNLCRPKDLFDPGDALLTLLFCGETYKFPGEKFCSDGWLKILRDAGLQSTCDADTVLECARRIEFLGVESMKHGGFVDEVSLEISSLAETLIRGIFENNIALLRDQGFCNAFGKIVCVPAEKGFPFEAEKKGVKRVLCAYSEAVLLKDWRLAWAAAPILFKEALVPPDYCWEAIHLQSPPPFTTVLKHLQANWWSTETSLFTIEEASLEVFKHLHKIWATLSSSDILELQQLAFIAADNGTRLATPDSIFANLTINLSPLASRLPSCYLPFVDILKELGVEDNLSVSCAMNILSNLHRSCGYYRLNPNELHAVIELLQFLCDRSDNPDWKSELVVPDDGCRLVRPSTCVYIDPYGSQYMKFIDSSRLRFVHGDVSERLCLALGITKLSNVVVEMLDHVEHLHTLEEAGSVSLASIKVKLLSRPFQVAVSSIANNFSSFTPGFKCPDFPTLQNLLKHVAKRLKLVRHIYTRFYLLPNSLDITLASNNPVMEESISRSGHRALYYVNCSKTCMLIATQPGYVSVPDVVAIVVSHILGSPVPLPIGSLFLCPQDSETELANILKLSSDERLAIEGVGCGNSFLGTHLSLRDEKKVGQQYYAGPFQKGEIVAWRNVDEEKMRYGRILKHLRPSDRKQAYGLKLEIFPGKTKYLISWRVSAFKNFTVEEDSSKLDLPLDSHNIVHQPQGYEGVNLSNQGQATEDSRVPAEELVESVKEMMSAAGVNMDKEKQYLLQTTLSLQDQLDESQAALVLEQDKSEKARKESESAWQCRMCWRSTVDVALVPCGHILCYTCTSHVTHCPFCAVQVSKTMKLYRP